MSISLSFNGPQAEAFSSPAKETVLCAGLGSGKSFLLAAKAYEWLAGHPGGVFGLFAPTTEQLANATFRQITEAWDLMHFHEGAHFVVNIRPPGHWRVPPFTKLRSTRILTTCWGSYLIMSGLDSFDTLRGIQFDGILVDEYRDVNEKAREVIVGRLRGKLFTALEKKTQVFYATTPPTNPAQLIAMRDNKKLDILFVTGTTHVNQHNLPADYIDTLRGMYDAHTFEREVMAKLLLGTDKPFAYAFSAEKHVSSLPGAALLDTYLPIYLSFDFNVDPQTCLAFQHDKTLEAIRVVREFRIENADIYQMCDRIRAEYGGFEYIYFYLTGDSSGASRHGGSKGLRNYYTIIREELGIPAERFDTPGRNMAHSDSRVLVNALLQNYPSIQIASDCPHLLADLQLVGIDADFKIDKSNAAMGHLLDCFRYYFHTYHFSFIKKATIIRHGE